MRLQDISLKYKLIMSFAVACLITLVIAISAIVYFEVEELENSSKYEADSIAELLADRSAAAILFSDSTRAQENLSSIRSIDEILNACLYEVDGNLFASFNSDLSLISCPDDEMNLKLGSIKNIDYVSKRAVMADNEIVGHIYLVSTLEPAKQRVGGFVVKGVLIGFVSLVVAFLIANWLQKIIVAPISRLSSTTAEIEKRQDYSIRSDVTGADEIGKLAKSVNAMLQTLESSNQQLIDSLNKIRFSEQRFRTLAESTSAIPWELDLMTQRFNYVGPQAENLLGYPLSRWYEQDFWIQHIREEDREMALQYRRNMTTQPGDGEVDYRIVAADGKVLWIRDLAQVENTSNNALIAHGLMIDVTMRRRSEEALKKIAAAVSGRTGKAFFEKLVIQLSELFDAKYAFIGRIDEDDPNFVNTSAISRKGKIIEPMTYALIHTPCEAVIGKSTCYFPENVQNLFPYDHLLVEMEAESYIGTPLFDQDKKPLGVIAVLDDRALNDIQSMVPILEIFAARVGAELERLHAEESLNQYRIHLEALVEARTAELQNINKELEAFSYSVSHDLRAPLRAINGFSEVLLEDYSSKLDQAGFDLLKRISAGANKMDELIDDILELSRVNRFEVRMTMVNISATAEECRKELLDSGLYRNVKWSILPDLIVSCDARLIRVVLSNLLDNACKYSSKNQAPQVEFGVSSMGNRKEYFVKDNGVGFDAIACASKLFTPFQRFHLEQDFPGTGIGLATVYRAVKRMQGDVRVQSQLGQGTTFYFSFDVEDNTMIRSDTARDSAGTFGNRKKS